MATLYVTATGQLYFILTDVVASEDSIPAAVWAGRVMLVETVFSFVVLNSFVSLQAVDIACSQVISTLMVCSTSAIPKNPAPSFVSEPINSENEYDSCVSKVFEVVTVLD